MKSCALTPICPAVEIVYGSSLEALRFASSKDFYIILEGPHPPDPYENADVKEEWYTLFVSLMLKGKVVGGDKVTGTHVNEEHIQVVSRGNVVNKIAHKKLYLFSDQQIFGLPVPRTEATRYEVVDHFIPLSLSLPHLHYIKTEDSFVNQIHILKPELRRKADIYVISYLNKKHLHDFDYSDTMVRFKCEELLKQNGFEGSANGKHKRLLRLEATSRTVREPMHHYEDTPRMKFCNGN